MLSYLRSLIMRRTVLILTLSALACPVFAQSPANTAAKASLDDFSAYSTFLVANANCSDLNFNVDTLKSALYRSADAMRWSERKRRREASDLVALNTRKLRADPAEFCAEARSMAMQYKAAGLRF
jgi:hypothetical protein